MRVRNLLGRVDRANAVRQTREGLWRLLQAYTRPTSLAYQEQQENADARERRILESTAARSAELFASFLMSNVLAAGTQNISSFRIALLNSGGVTPRGDIPPRFREWQEDAVDAVRHSLYSGRFAATEALHNACLDLGVFGSACFAAWDINDPNRSHTPVSYRHYPVWCVSGERGADGVTDTIYITEKLTRRQARQRWPQHEEIWNAQPEDGEVEVVFCALSARDPDVAEIVPPGVQEAGGAWYGVWALRAPEMILQASAYPEQPVFLVSWYSVDNTPWGRSPAMTALGDTITSNGLLDLMMRGTEKLVDPPWMVRDGALLSPLRNYPGSITHTDGEDAIRPLLPPGASRIELGAELLRDRIKQIEQAFFIHLFTDQNPSGSKQPRTAFEVAQHEDERNRAVAPMVLRMQSQLLDPLIWRVLGILTRRGVIQPPPLEEGQRLKLVHSSPVVSSQQQMDGMNLLRWAEGIAFLAQISPEIADWLNTDRAAAVLHHAAMAPARTLRRQDEVQAIREQRAEQQALQQQLEQSAIAGETAAKLITAQRR